LKNLFIYPFLILTFCVGFYACDSTTSPIDPLSEEPTITRFSMTPQHVQFSPTADGIKDTTVNVRFEVSTENLPVGNVPLLHIMDNYTNEVAYEIPMNGTPTEDFFVHEIPFETKTTFFEEYTVNVLLSGSPNNLNYAQGSLELFGFSVVPPEILEIDNPETLQRPEEDEPDVPVPFFAKATDEEGLDSIEGVYLRLISRESGELDSSPFRLYDDGENGGDLTAGDSLFTLVFQFSSENQIETYDAYYYAVDRGGLVSDTVKSVFRVIE